MVLAGVPRGRARSLRRGPRFALAVEHVAAPFVVHWTDRHPVMPRAFLGGAAAPPTFFFVRIFGEGCVRICVRKERAACRCKLQGRTMNKPSGRGHGWKGNGGAMGIGRGKRPQVRAVRGAGMRW